MQLHQMQLPREVIVGNKILDSIVDVCIKLGFSQSAFIVTGHRSYEVAGHRIIDTLEDSGIHVGYEKIASCTMEEVNSVGATAKKSNPQVILGIGGGSKIDVAKLSASNLGLPFMSIPTTASHDGIASPLASIKGSDKPYSLMAQAPMAIIADTDIIVEAPHRSTASGCGDVIAKFTAVQDWQLSHMARGEYYGEYAASLALMSAKLVAKSAKSFVPRDEAGLRVLLEALISCGVAMSIAGSSRPSSGSEHLFSHALDMLASTPAMHGEQVGVGTVMMALLHKMNWKNIRSKLRKVGAPTTANELGVTPHEIIKALVNARSIRPKRYTILNEKKLDYESAQALARKTGII